jgi:integrase
MLKKRGQWWSYRKRVPNHLRSLFGGRREIVVSLKTQDEGEARVRVLSIAHETEKALQRAREKHRALVVDPDAMARQWRTDILRFDQQDRIDRPRTEESLEAEIDALESAVEDNRTALQKGDTRPVLSVLRDVLERHQVHLTPPVERQLAHALLRERADALEIALQRALGQWRDEPVAPLSPLVSQALAAYLKERQLPSKTELEVKATFARFKVACGGQDKPIASVTKDDVRRFRELLLGDSAKSGKGKGALAPATIRKYLNLLGTVFRYAVRTGLLDRSPVEGMSFVARGGKRGEDQREKRQPFSTDQLKTLFTSPLYAGCDSVNRRTTPGGVVVKDALWWVFPLTLYSGMRIEEAMGLRAEDVHEVEGVLCFVVDPRPDRPLKTASSRRVIPVHDALIRMGLMDRVKGKKGLLFPELRPDAKHGTYTAALSKKAGRYLRAIGMPPTVTTHSTRHSTTDKLRAAGVQEGIIAAILGHSVQGMTARYGRGWDVKALASAIATIEYPGGTCRGGQE